MVFATAANAASVSSSNLSGYVYADTKKVVSFVEEAADLLAKKGKTAFIEFGDASSKWLGDDYLFVYTADGVTAF